MKSWRRLDLKNVILAIVLATGCGPWLEAVAATYVVTHNAESGPGSLRQAILDSNQLGGSNHIILQVDGITPVTSGELLITNNLGITGIGSQWFWLQGNYSNRIFHIVNASVTISGITIINGSNSIGGGIWQQSGSLTLNDCRITKNKAINGGGIAQTDGTLIVTDSVISSNNASGTGIGLYLQGNSTTTLRRCNLLGNSGTGFTTSGGGFSHNGLSLTVEGSTFCANGGTGGNGGGGLNNSGNALITGCTFLGNYSWQGGGIAAMGGTVTIRSSILASNFSSVTGVSAAPDCFGTIVSGGYNLVGNRTNSTGWSVTGDQLGTTQAPINPKLGPLQFNGGPMPTMAPLAGSPALDRGHSGGATLDQRGYPRTVDVSLLVNPPGGDGTDVGAVEREIRHVIVQSVSDFGPGTLREAILNASPEEVTEISFSWELESDTIVLSSELFLNTDIIINGPGAPFLAVTGAGGRRAINVTAGRSSISGLTFRGFNLTGFNGNSREKGETAMGGAILNQGTLHLSDCIISNNWVKGGMGGPASDGTAGAGGDGLGGAVANLTFGILSMTRCLLAHNSATGGPGGEVTDESGFPGQEGNAFGGSFYNAGNAELTNCCVHNSSVFASNTPDRGTAAGGGIYNLAHTLNLITCTVASNTAWGGSGGGIYDGGGPGFYRSTTIAFNQADFGGGIDASGADFGNTLIAGNTADIAADAKGILFSSDYNFIQSANGSAVIGAYTYCIFGLDPLLGPLQDNGGPMPTIALLPGSPALDRGTNFGIVSDLRGRSRPCDLEHLPNVVNGNGTDIGAYELNATWLQLTRAFTNAILSWTTNDPSLQLEATTDLAAPASWVTVPNPPAISSNKFIVVEPLQARKFYRLR